MRGYFASKLPRDHLYCFRHAGGDVPVLLACVVPALYFETIEYEFSESSSGDILAFTQMTYMGPREFSPELALILFRWSSNVAHLHARDAPIEAFRAAAPLPRNLQPNLFAWFYWPELSHLHRLTGQWRLYGRETLQEQDPRSLFFRHDVPILPEVLFRLQKLPPVAWLNDPLLHDMRMWRLLHELTAQWGAVLPRDRLKDYIERRYQCRTETEPTPARLIAQGDFTQRESTCGLAWAISLHDQVFVHLGDRRSTWISTPASAHEFKSIEGPKQRWGGPVVPGAKTLVVLNCEEKSARGFLGCPIPAGIEHVVFLGDATRAPDRFIARRDLPLALIEVDLREEKRVAIPDMPLRFTSGVFRFTAEPSMLRHFLQHHGGKKPLIVFTYHDAREMSPLVMVPTANYAEEGSNRMLHRVLEKGKPVRYYHGNTLVAEPRAPEPFVLCREARMPLLSTGDFSTVVLFADPLTPKRWFVEAKRLALGCKLLVLGAREF